DGAERMPKREAMALGLDGDALDRGRDAGSGQRLPTTEGSQAASNVAGRSGSSPQQRLTRCPCSPSHRRLTSISAATASQCSTKRRDTPTPSLSVHYCHIARSPNARYQFPSRLSLSVQSSGHLNPTQRRGRSRICRAPRLHSVEAYFYCLCQRKLSASGKDARPRRLSIDCVSVQSSWCSKA